MPDLHARRPRHALRALVLTPAAVLLLLSAPAFAAPPESWTDPEPVGGLDFLLLLLLIPLGLALLIALLAYVPSMVRGQKYTPGRAWRSESEWFGGPKDGLEAADKVDLHADGAQTDRGGASARW